MIQRRLYIYIVAAASFGMVLIGLINLGSTALNQLLKATPGLTPRILSHRLSELEKEGIIERVERRKGPNFVRWRLTEKGNDTIPILMRFSAFGSKWYADQVFEDKTPKRLREVYPAWEAQSVESRYP